MSFCPKHSNGHNHWNKFSNQKQFHCRKSRYAEWKFDRLAEKKPPSFQNILAQSPKKMHKN